MNLDVNPDKSERLAWVGPGKTAFLDHPADADAALGSGSINSSPQDAAEDGPKSEGDTSSDDGSADTDRETQPRWITASNVAEWIGEDGGPGERDGLCAFLDDEGVGSVVLPPVRSEALTPVLRFALEHPQIFLFVQSAEYRDDPRPTIQRPLPNVAQLRLPRDCEYDLRDLARCIESRDFVPRVVRSLLPPRAPSDASSASGAKSPTESTATSFWRDVEEELVSILAWRRWSGLERSLDFGTRWVVFESAMPALIRSIDRGVRGFLRQLTLDGFFPTLGGWEVEVRYASEPHDPNEGKLILRVDAGLAGEFGVALSRAVEPDGSLVAPGFRTTGAPV